MTKARNLACFILEEFASKVAGSLFYLLKFQHAFFSFALENVNVTDWLWKLQKLLQLRKCIFHAEMGAVTRESPAQLIAE